MRLYEISTFEDSSIRFEARIMSFVSAHPRMAHLTATKEVTLLHGKWPCVNSRKEWESHPLSDLFSLLLMLQQIEIFFILTPFCGLFSTVRLWL